MLEDAVNKGGESLGVFSRNGRRFAAVGARFRSWVRRWVGGPFFRLRGLFQGDLAGPEAVAPALAVAQEKGALIIQSADRSLMPSPALD